MTRPGFGWETWTRTHRQRVRDVLGVLLELGTADPGNRLDGGDQAEGVRPDTGTREPHPRRMRSMAAYLRP